MWHLVAASQHYMYQRRTNLCRAFVTLLKMSASWNLQKLRSHKDPTLIFMMLLSSLITVELAQFHMLILETVYPLSEYFLLLMKLTFFSNATTLTAIWDWTLTNSVKPSFPRTHTMLICWTVVLQTIVTIAIVAMTASSLRPKSNSETCGVFTSK